MGETWITQQPNFDNIYWAMTSLFILSTLENWSNNLYIYMDSDMPEYGPSKDNYQYFAFYVIGFIMVGSFFLINLFVGVICFYFEKASKSEKKRGNVLLTFEQENWIEIQRMTVAVGTEYIPVPKNKFRRNLFNFTKTCTIHACM
jgi:type IV secretory pathway TraG/TraD family ATPase VirD4